MISKQKRFFAEILTFYFRYVNGKKVSGIKALPSNECIGIYKRYHICNDQECPIDAIDFREEQCKSFNNKTFGGKKYLWETYFKGTY